MKPVKKKNQSAEDFAIVLKEWADAQAALPAEERDPEYADYLANADTNAANTVSVAVEEKTVKFRPFVNHKCTIGGQKIILVKDEETRLLESHAIILAGAKKGYRI